jgi:hypothetical protein
VRLIPAQGTPIGGLAPRWCLKHASEQGVIPVAPGRPRV